MAQEFQVERDGGRFTYGYDLAGRVRSLFNPQTDRTTFAYDAAGRRTSKRLANGTRASFSYDAASRLVRLDNLKSDGAVISSFDYRYDQTGNRTHLLEASGDRVTWTYDKPINCGASGAPALTVTQPRTPMTPWATGSSRSRTAC